MKKKTKTIQWCKPQLCENPVWENAYSAFESRKQAVKKMKSRLQSYQIGKRLKTSDLILDLFCGTGCMSEALKELGYNNTVGLDLSISLLSKNRASKKLICGNAIKTKFPENTFHAIFIQGGLHHIPGRKNVKRVLFECHRTLKKNGLLFITEPFNDLFLRAVHLTLAISPWLPKKLASLKTMIQEEKKTYFSWLVDTNLLLCDSYTKFRIIKKQVKLEKINLILVKPK